MNPDNFRVFGPDETKSNRLDAVFEFGKAWMAKVLPEDEDEGYLSPFWENHGDALRAYPRRLA